MTRYATHFATVTWSTTGVAELTNEQRAHVPLWARLRAWEQREREEPEPAVDPRQEAFRFPNVWCSQCGSDFGPGPHGFSHCDQHAGRKEVR